MSTVLIRYNAGNLRSVGFALQRLGVSYTISDDPLDIRKAGRVIFPGVGHAQPAMQYLKERGLDILIPTLTQPFLGICLGMQLMCSISDEGPSECLGLFQERVIRFNPRVGKIPHMGWNTIRDLRGPLFRGINPGAWAYFVHSYFVPDSPMALCRTEYGGDSFSSGLAHRNFFGLQFHPERSGETGMEILRNFISL